MMLKRIVGSLICLAVTITISNASYGAASSIGVHHNFPMFDGFYGGDQGWWDGDDEKKRRRVGCAPTAGANILAYLAMNNQVKGIFKDVNKIKKSEYFALMDKVFDEMIPANSLMRFSGVSSSTYFAKTMKKIASGYALDIDYKDAKLEGKKSEDIEKFANFLEVGGLDSSRPVVLFIGSPAEENESKYKEKDINKEAGEYFSEHAVTITDYIKDANGERYITVSSWGKEYRLNLNALAERRTSLDAVYFVVNSQEETELKVANY